jgi:hypothetical protein
MNGRASLGFNDVVLSFEWQLLVSYGFILAAASGLAFSFIRYAEPEKSSLGPAGRGQAMLSTEETF